MFKLFTNPNLIPWIKENVHFRFLQGPTYQKISDDILITNYGADSYRLINNATIDLLQISNIYLLAWKIQKVDILYYYMHC